MLSPNLLKSQIPNKVGGGRGGEVVGWGGNQLPTFDAESKSAKIPNSPYGVGGGEGGGDQLSTFDAESKSANT